MKNEEPRDGEVWYKWSDLEESDSAMWRETSRKKTWVAMAIAFSSDAELYGEWMLRVLEVWPKSCEHNLSKQGDKCAWIGHAAAALAFNCPEHVMREAWGHLTSRQQDLANEKASLAIEKWRESRA